MTQAFQPVHGLCAARHLRIPRCSFASIPWLKLWVEALHRLESLRHGWLPLRSN